MNKTSMVISFGEVLWDLIDGRAYLGGAPFNLAAHATRLGMDAMLISRVGDDDLGRTALAEAARLGVGVTGVVKDGKYPTGTVEVRLSSGGEPDYTIHEPAAWDFIEMHSETIPISARSFVDAVCFGTLAQRAQVSREALRSLLEALPDTPAFYDVNLRQNFYSKEIVEWGLHRANVVKVNDTEAVFLGRLLFGRAMTETQFAGVLRAAYELDVVLVTLGADGCLTADSSGVTHVPGRKVEVADAVGAGDAFSAAFLSVWLRGAPAARAAAYGNMLGAYVASQHGAAPEYSDDIRMLLREHRTETDLTIL